MKSNIISICLLMAAIAGPAAATTSANIRSEAQQAAESLIRAMVEAPQDGEVEIKAVPLDTRLRLAPCQQPLLSELAGKGTIGSHTTVRVACPDSEGWNIYIPVRVKTMRPVVVARHALPANTILDEGMLQTTLKDSKLIHNHVFSDYRGIIGSKVRRHVQAGQPILGRNLCLVCKGDAVTIIASSKNLQLKADGVALANAGNGERVSVRNSRSRRIVEARVVSVGVVEVLF